MSYLLVMLFSSCSEKYNEATLKKVGMFDKSLPSPYVYTIIIKPYICDLLVDCVLFRKEKSKFRQ